MAAAGRARSASRADSFAWSSSSRAASVRSRSSTASRLSSTAPSSPRRRSSSASSALKPRPALGDVPVEMLELRLALREIGGAEAQHPLDRCAHVAEKRLSALEVLEGVLEARRLFLELAASLGEEPLELLLGARGVRKDAAGDVGLHVFRPCAGGAVGLGGASSSCDRLRMRIALSIARTLHRDDAPARRSHGADAKAGRPIVSRRFGSAYRRSAISHDRT